MMKKLFKVIDELSMIECVEAIKIKTLEEKPFQVSILEGDKLRTDKQNRLYWKHVGEIHINSYDLKNNIHYDLKRNHLHPIFMVGDTAKNIEYRANYSDLCKVKAGGLTIDFQRMHNKVLSTTDATPKQMAQYIESYWCESNQNGLILTDPKTFMSDESEINYA